MSELEVEGKTVDEAIEKGLAELNISRDEIEVDVIDKGNPGGIFGIGTKPAKVKLSTKSNPKVSVSEPSLSTEQSPSVEIESITKDVVSKILTLMGINHELRTVNIGGRILVNIDTEHSALLIGRQGLTLDALEYLSKLIISRKTGFSVQITLDIEDYRARQEKKLIEMAHHAAREVQRTGKEYEFKPMTARERKIIHTTLQSVPQIETFSQGEDKDRHLIVRYRTDPSISTNTVR